MGARKRKKTDGAEHAGSLRGGSNKVASRSEPVVAASNFAQTPLSPVPSWRSTVAPAVIIVLAGIAAYANSFAGEFVFDDEPCITDNRSIRHLWPLSDVLFPPRELEATGVSGRPLLNLSFAINYALGGKNVWGYHAVNLAIHLLAGLTLFGIVRRTLLLPVLRDRFGAHATILALAVALLWIVHPLQTAAVTYTVQRAESLVGFFYLANLYCVLRGATGGKPKVWFTAAVIICLCGMTTKEVMVTAPVVTLLYDRTFLAGTFRETIRQRGGLYLALAATWLAIVWGLIASDFHHGTTGLTVQEFTPWTYLTTQPGVILNYLRLAVWPVGLCFDYGWPAARGLTQVAVPGLVIAALIALTCWAVWKRPPLGFLGAWFFLILSPTSSFVPIQDAAFEHRMYLSLAAIAAAVVLVSFACIQEVSQCNRVSKAWVASLQLGLLAMALVCLTALTFRRNRDYVNELALMEQTITQAPNNARAHHNLGRELLRNNRTDEAVRSFKRALELDPKLALPHFCLGIIYGDRNQVDDAIVEFQQAVRLQPDYTEALIQLASSLAKMKRPLEALPYFERALRLAPDNAALHNNYAGALLQLGKPDEAGNEFRKALTLKPDYSEALMNYVMLLSQQGKYREAAAFLSRPGKCLEAVALLSQKRKFQEAAALLREGVASQPRDLGLVNQLAWVLATSPDDAVRDGRKAIALAENSARISGDENAAVMDTLAAAHAETGDFAKAIEWQQKAVAAAPPAEKSDFAARLKLYQAGKAYRDEPRPPGVR